MNNLIEKEKKITTEISLAEFIVPNRKRVKTENSKITTSTPKWKKRNNTKRTSSLTTYELEDDKETNEKQKHKRSNTESKSNQSHQHQQKIYSKQ